MENRLEFIMMIGLSGSGKSGAAADVLKKKLDNGEKAIILSSDEIRRELFGEEYDYKHNSKVFQTLNEKTIEWLKWGYSVIYDATNLSARRRKHIVKEAVRVGAYPRCELMLTPLNICLFRDSERKESVGSEVIARQLKSFQPPYFNEGWKEVNINEGNQYLYDIGHMELVNMMLVNGEVMYHDNPYHEGTILDHLIRVADIYNWENIGLLHDVGKMLTKEFGPDGIAHYKGHENVSAYFSLFWQTEIRSDALLRAHVISLHMRKLSMDKKRYEKFLSELDEEVREKLVKLNKADEEGC